MLDPSRVAARFMIAKDYFAIGDFVYYGKYKNHVGKIVAFDQDHHGNPTVEIEPIPKGRKQNKVMGLFKMWRKDVKDHSLAEKAKQQALEEAAKLEGKTATGDCDCECNGECEDD
jgi:hypothetical protein